MRALALSALLGCLWGEVTQAGDAQSAKHNTPQAAKVAVDADGTVLLQAVAVPYSRLSSDEARKNFLQAHGKASSCKGGEPAAGDIKIARKWLDDCFMRPGVAKLRATFPVEIRPERIAGVPSDVIEPAAGVAEKNRRRVLINLHGGGFVVAAGLGGKWSPFQSPVWVQLKSFRLTTARGRNTDSRQQAKMWRLFIESC